MIINVRLLVIEWLGFIVVGGSAVTAIKNAKIFCISNIELAGFACRVSNGTFCHCIGVDVDVCNSPGFADAVVAKRDVNISIAM